MIRLADAITRPLPESHWKMLKQIGVDDAVIALPRGFASWRTSTNSDQPWDYAPLAMYQEMLEGEGLTVSVVEDWPPMEDIQYGRAGREEAFENIASLIRSMGKLGIPVWSYGWAPGLSWLRTSMTTPTRGGAITTAYDDRKIDHSTPTRAGRIDAESLRANLVWFLDRIIPIAEEANVKISLHPDDPPLPEIRGIARVLSSINDFEWLLEANPSPMNGITFCQGNFTLMTDDVPTAIKHLGSDDRIHFVHYRDVRGTADRFVETFHDQGQTDMLACMRAYRDIGFEGVMRPDHVPTLDGDRNPEVPGYALMGRLHAIGYMAGLREAAYGPEAKQLAADRSALPAGQQPVTTRLEGAYSAP